MSVVIIGGHDRMVCTYKDICKQFNCKARVFTQQPANLKTQIGCPDLLVLFTSTVSHQVAYSVLQMTKNIGTAVVRSHNNSSCVLKDILVEYCC